MGERSLKRRKDVLGWVNAEDMKEWSLRKKLTRLSGDPEK